MFLIPLIYQAGLEFWTSTARESRSVFLFPSLRSGGGDRREWKLFPRVEEQVGLRSRTIVNRRGITVCENRAASTLHKQPSARRRRRHEAGYVWTLLGSLERHESCRILIRVDTSPAPVATLSTLHLQPPPSLLNQEINVLWRLSFFP